MTCDIIKIGTSKGIRIPSILLKKFNNPTSFEIEFDANKIVLIPKKRKNPREGWSEAFEKMANSGDDELLIDDEIDIDLETVDEV